MTIFNHAPHFIAARPGSGGAGTGNHGAQDYFVAKLGSTGALKWSRCYGGINSDMACFIRQAPDGGYIIAGETLSTNGDVSGNHGGFDYWVLKVDAFGDL